MATYPVLPLSRESRRRAVNGIVTDHADDGTPWARDFHARRIYVFDIIHPLISLSEAQSVEDFFESVRGEAFNFLYAKDGKTYTCYFTSPPETDRERGQFWRAESQLVGFEET